MTTFRLLGMTDEDRLAFEEETGIKTEAARLIVEESVRQSQDLYSRAMREVQEIVGPHGAISRVQAGSLRITPGEGFGAYADGILKTTITNTGDLIVGSDISNPETTTLYAFVIDEVYNGEEFGAGDLLIGDNSGGVANVKYDASEGQLQFRSGDTVNVYVDTDGSLKAGGGAVLLNEEGITLEMGTADENQIKWVDSGVYRAVIYAFTSLNIDQIFLSVGNGLATRSAYVGITAVAPTTNDSDIHLESGFGSSRNAAIRVSSPTSPGQPNIKLNYWGFNVDTQILGQNDDNLLFADASTDRVGIGTNSPTAKLDVRGTVIINEAGEDFDTRIEGDTDPNLVTVDAGNDNVTIGGTSASGHKLAVDGIVKVRDGSDNTAIQLSNAASTETVINEQGVDSDTRIEGDTDPNLVTVDAGNDNVTIGGTSASGHKLAVDGIVKVRDGSDNTAVQLSNVASTATVINEQGVDSDTRIEGDTDPNLLFADASTDRVGVGTSTPAQKLDVNGHINVATGKTVLQNGATAFMLTPGGRLSLTTGVPVTSSDVTGATTIYYTPYLHNMIELWDGTYWIPIPFTEVSLALGTMTASRGYDVFAYLSSGALAIEILVWTSATARATAITLQDGRYCKSGDKTRLYLGSFYSRTTTQTDDAEATRFLWNMYNRRPRSLKVENNSSHNYNTGTIRAWNNDQANSDFEYFIGLQEDALNVAHFAQILRASTDGNPRSRFGINSTTAEQGNYGLAIATLVGRLTGGASYNFIPSLGYSYICVLEFSTAGTAPGATFEAAALTGVVQA